MAHDLTREDLKRNELGEALEASVHYAEGHLRTILGIVGGLAAMAIVVWGVWYWRSSRVESANELLGDALRVSGGEVVASGAKPDDPLAPTFASEAERDGRARELFERLAASSGPTGAGAAARLWLAERAFAAGDRAGARRRWQEVAEPATGELAAAARLALARLDREEGKGEALAVSLRQELDSGTGALPADVLLAELARTYETLGKAGDAAAAWKRLVDQHPESAYADLARQQLAASGAPGV
jgi:hypothetical protein